MEGKQGKNSALFKMRGLSFPSISVSLIHIFIHILIWSNTWHRGEHREHVFIDTGSAVWMLTVKRGDRELKIQEQQYRLTALTEICVGCHEMNLSTWQIFTEKWLDAREGLSTAFTTANQRVRLIQPLSSWERECEQTLHGGWKQAEGWDLLQQGGQIQSH